MSIHVTPEQVALVGTIIASFLEVIKLIPEILKKETGIDYDAQFKKALPSIAIVLGITLNYLFIAPTEVVAKDVIFEGALFGLAAIGGREAVLSVSKNKSKKTTNQQ